MISVLSCIVVQHDISLVLLAAALCAFGSWATSRIFRTARSRPMPQAQVWYFLTAATAGVSIWCTHFVAMLGFRPGVPVNFDLGLTFASLVIAILGCTFGFLFTAIFRFRFASAIGGAILGLTLAGMHYAGMIAYRVQGLVIWDKTYLIVSIVCAVVLCAAAVCSGARSHKYSEFHMAGILTAAIVSLHFIGMTAFHVEPLEIAGNYVNPEALRVLALAIAGIALLIVLGGLLSYMIEGRARLENIAELPAARNAAEAASRAKSEFLSVLSHELRTPLTIVLGYAGMLSHLKEAQSPEPNSTIDPAAPKGRTVAEQADKYGRKITTSANHLLSLINEILDYTSMELGDAKLQKKEFSLHDLLEDVRDQFQVMSAQKNAALVVECDQIDAFADRGRILQILINLVGNAMKFSKASQITLRGKRQGSGYVIEVADNGIGIPEDKLEVIFEAFQQVESADHRAAGGTGLGLAICERLAVAHGGTIAARSTLGAGTVFTVTMPAEAIFQEAAPAGKVGFVDQSRLAS